MIRYRVRWLASAGYQQRYASTHSLGLAPSLWISDVNGFQLGGCIFVLECVTNCRSEVNDDDEGWIGYIGKALKTSASYLPAPEILTQGRDYAIARLPMSGAKNVCAVVKWVLIGLLRWVSFTWNIAERTLQREAILHTALTLTCHGLKDFICVSF